MKINLQNNRLRSGSLCSHALISALLIGSLALTGGAKGNGKEKARNKDKEISWNFESYKIRSSSVLSLAIANSIGSGEIQILTGCYNTGELALYKKTTKGLKYLRNIGQVQGGITDMKLLSMDGAQNKAVVSHEGKGSLQIFDLRTPSSPLSLFHGPSSINHLEIADLNNDGLGDIIPVSYDGNTEVWFENEGNRGFIKRKLPLNSRKVSAIKVIDFDKDGDADILMASDHNKMIKLFVNKGNGEFDHTAIAKGIRGVLDIEALDMNMDGLMDVAYASYKEKRIQLLVNRGTSFESKNVSTKLKSLNNIEVFDMGRDGRPDLIITSFADDAIRVIENSKTGLREHQFQATVPAPTAIAVKADPVSNKTTFYVSSMAKNKVYAIGMNLASQ